MLARKYARKIAIYDYVEADDGFGGTVSEPRLVKSVWAEINSKGATKFSGNGYGYQDFKKPVIFRIRGKKNSLQLSEKSFVRYKEQDYAIKGLEDVNLEGMEVNIFTDGE